MNAASIPHTVPRLDTDILLVGLGPVGAALANLLGRYGVRVLAIDKATAIFEKPRAIALDNEALRILQLAGVREGEFETVAIPHVQYRSPLFGRFARINTAGIIDGHPALVTFYQPELERVLRGKLAQYPGVEVRLGSALAAFADDGRFIQARLEDAAGNETHVRARYLVGTDGANSLVRRTLGLDFEGRSFHQDWLIVDALDVPDPIDHVEFTCDPRRPSPRMVAPGGRQRWEFMLRPGERPEEMERPESVRQLLAPWCDSQRIRIERTAVYRFHAREAKRFSRGRCFLAGDAAHITPPFAGQGLVAGLRDAANLAWKLAWVLQGRANEGVLDSYDTERRPHARKIIRLARTLGAIVMPQSRPAAFAVHGLMSLLRLLPTGRAMFEDMKVKPQNTFDHGLFWRVRGSEQLRAGAMLPQGWVRPATGGGPVLSDDALGMQWALIGFGVDLSARLPAELLQFWQAAGGRVWQWCQRSQAQHLAPASQRLEALDEALLPRRVPLGWVAIVRPDRCVLAEGPASKAETMLRQALELIAPPASSAAAPRRTAAHPIQEIKHAA
ncbi:bifunctional 3-(3-hydroxy-phenyl)propionate/3-hydroxycinnamic acid hydroxylase [Variovorax sp. J22R133]|uniref:bifunctional 3-(3-hydroxy-phenyl)propionate/3-hydroxycinnamic acid hydroxylase n=1 Tax=Variovorax brevis TaxID=3053503 RepID=UPI0025786D98|nr:bifunctional 3-(3-hydroxy-phenyl)propionate/3-hydroxycinnamic acid hydroxylase [Variovorax sp. J22R133]MDM0116673.1 bifunctional 3-(3-hydroxy-phenyl)propionate/3-hydroxycinnamic acid hydroxylase [Variovorax sp. J22R133]